MNTRSFVLAFGVCAVSACGSETSPGGGGTGAGGASTTSTTDSTSTSTTDTSTTTDTTTSSTTTSTVVCESEPDFASCYDCLVTQDPAGYAAFTNAMFGACGCDPGAPCAAECDTAEPTTNVCGPPVDASKADASCSACIQGLTPGEPCFSASQMACAEDPACAGFTAEVQGCPP